MTITPTTRSQFQLNNFNDDETYKTYAIELGTNFFVL